MSTSSDLILVRAVKDAVAGTRTAPATANSLRLLADGFDAQIKRTGGRTTYLDGTIAPELFIPGDSSLEMSLPMPLVGSITAGAAPKFGDLLLAGGFGATVTAAAAGITARTEYAPSIKSGSARTTVSPDLYQGGLLIQGVSGMASVEVAIKAGEAGKFLAKLKSTITTAPTAVAQPTDSSFSSGWGDAISAGPVRTSKVRLGAANAVTMTNAVLAGGTEFRFVSYDYDSGAVIPDDAWCGGREYELTKHVHKSKLSVLLTPAERVLMESRYAAGTGLSLGFTHGLTAAGAAEPGKSSLIHHKDARISDIKFSKYGGLWVAELELMPQDITLTFI